MAAKQVDREAPEEAAEAAVSTVDSEFGRTTDPVRLYMREMGSFDLLTREGEVESTGFDGGAASSRNNATVIQPAKLDNFWQVLR